MPRPSWATEQAWEVIQAAKAVALSEEAGEILTRHLFQGCSIVASTGDLMREALRVAGLNADEADTYIQRIKPTATLPDPASALLPVSSQAEGAIEEARRLAIEHPAEAGGQVAPVHLWVGICLTLDDLKEWLLECGWSESLVCRLPEVARTQLPPRKPVHSTLKEGWLRILKEFCSRDLTELARQGQLSPAYGTEGITEQLVRCLLRKDKRGVVLTGPAGVGKTKLVEDLALRIAKGELPELEGCHVFELDLVLFTQGAHLASGSRAERWARLTEVLRANSERIILFIDELHTVVGLPLEGRAMDLANALKPLLVDDRVRIIGATTPHEYRQYIEGDPALARRFTEIRLPEPDGETMLMILRRVAPEYEEYHGIKYSSDALEEIYKLTKAYLPNQFFPAKAIDLLDEVGVAVKRMRNRSGARQGAPVVQPEDVREALKRRWGVEPELFTPNLAELIKEKVVGQDHAAERLADLIIASAFRYGKEERRGPRAVILFLGPPGVGKSYMAQVLAEILFPGRDSLLELDMTEFGGESPHAGEHARFRLLGPPPPYYGWETGGVLTNHALQHPVSVVLIDEFDKACSEARNVLLRIFAEGWAQDGRGRLISFREIYFILTANAGRKLWQKIREIGFKVDSEREGEGIREDLAKLPEGEEELRGVLLEEGFTPELLSRISNIVLFNSLTREDLEEIARLWLAGLRDSAVIEDLLLLEYEEEALSRWLVEQCGGEPDCRRLRAVFERQVEMSLARWRMQMRRGSDIAILRLEPADTGIELIPEGRPESKAKQLLFEQVAAIFARREQYERRQRATRVLLGTAE